MATNAAGARSAKRGAGKGRSSIGLWVILGSVLVVGLVLVVVALANRAPISAIEQPDVPAEWINGRTLGNPDAPVTISMWEDFLCPACQQWNEQVKPQLFEDYIQAGTVKMEYNYLPLQQHGNGARWGAVASECADEQGAFWPYHDRLFQLASTQGQTAFSTDRLIGHAADLGLDRDEFNRCLTSGEHMATVDASLNQAGAQGISSTPTMLINGQPANAFAYEQVSATIDELAGE